MIKTGETVRDPVSRSPAPRQKAYLLRLWETRSVPPDDPTTWRFSLEDLQSHEQHGFATLEALVTFLDEHTRLLAGRPAPEVTAMMPVDHRGCR